MKEISTISPREMISLWWSVRWVRGLVLMLIPVGIVDTIFTVGMAIQYGPEIEFNPVTRWFLAAGLWPLWAIINITAFTFFCMLAGSYYLHTRNLPAGPDTFWLSLIISLRIGMTAYNVTFFYIPVVVTVYPPFWVAFFAFCGSLYLTNNLFRRERDLTWRSATGVVTSRLDDRYDARLIKEAMVGITLNDNISNETPTQKPYSTTSRKTDVKPMKKNFWMHRLAYFAGFLLSFVAMAVALNVIAIITDFTRWQYDLPVFNVFTGTIFVASFAVIIFFIGLSMFFLFRAFTIMQDDEIPM